MSRGPPAGAEMMRRIGLLGNCWAAASYGVAKTERPSEAHRAIAVRRRRRTRVRRTARQPSRGSMAWQSSRGRIEYLDHVLRGAHLARVGVQPRVVHGVLGQRVE